MCFLLSTDPGIERVAVEELRGHGWRGDARPEPYGRPGQVRVVGASAGTLLRLRTIHHVVDLRAEDRVGSLDELRDVIGRTRFDELAAARSFRVSSACSGRDDVDRIGVQRAAGAVLHERYGTPVDLEGFEVNVRVDLHEGQLVAGIQLTRRSLGDRVRRGKALRSSLKPTIAAAMVRLAGAHEASGRLIDPMCGTGVIPVEAAAVNPSLEIEATDWDPPTVEVARKTFANHGLSLDARVADARRLGHERPGWFDFIVTDPPYGLRQGRRTSIGALYRELLGSFEPALRPDGRLAVVVVKRRTFRAALERTRLSVVRECTTGTGEVPLSIFVLAPRGRHPADTARPKTR